MLMIPTTATAIRELRRLWRRDFIGTRLVRGCSIAGDQDWEVAGDTHRGRRSLIGYVTLHEGSFILADDHHQDDGDDGNDNKEAIGDVPAEVVDQQTNAGRC